MERASDLKKPDVALHDVFPDEYNDTTIADFTYFKASTVGSVRVDCASACSETLTSYCKSNKSLNRLHV